jgi:phosphoglycolate phosphatase-like HAD superfamily hydrolase
VSLRDRVVVLDFDGVVWDSVDESFEQAWTAWKAVHGAPPVEKEVAHHLFREARWQCKDGYDFCIVMELVGQGREDVGEMRASDFRAMRETLAKGEAAERFVHAFYESRAQMRDADFEGWCALQGAFPGVVEQIGAIRQEALGIAVATTKDAASARALLAHAGIRDLPIYGREVSLDKRVHLGAIREHYGVEMGSLAFVEDLLENLRAVADLGLHLVLADWGYNTPAERERARAEGVTVVSMERFARALRGLWPD